MMQWDKLPFRTIALLAGGPVQVLVQLPLQIYSFLQMMVQMFGSMLPWWETFMVFVDFFWLSLSQAVVGLLVMNKEWKTPLLISSSPFCHSSFQNTLKITMSTYSQIMKYNWYLAFNKLAVSGWFSFIYF